MSRGSLEDQLVRTKNRPTGFDYLRIALSVSVLAAHTVTVCYGTQAETVLWSGPLRPLVYFIVPSFFALSGFLVAGSRERNSLPAFLTLRVLRIYPALTAEVVISAFLIGAALTILPLHQYFTSRTLLKYLLNVTGYIHYRLPGVFETLPTPNIVNAQLWTVPFELEC